MPQSYDGCQSHYCNFYYLSVTMFSPRLLGFSKEWINFVEKYDLALFVVFYTCDNFMNSTFFKLKNIKLFFHIFKHSFLKASLSKNQKVCFIIHCFVAKYSKVFISNQRTIFKLIFMFSSVYLIP